VAAVPDVPEPVAGRPRTAIARDAFGTAQRHRRWIAAGGIGLLLMVGANRCADQFSSKMGAAVSGPINEQNKQNKDMIAAITAAKTAPSQVSVQTPLSNYGCPVSADASTMVGYDPKTQYATLDPSRSGNVDTQVRALTVQNPLSSLRITAPDATTLTVMVGGTKGVPLFDCSGGVTPKQGGDTATTPTTAAPR